MQDAHIIASVKLDKLASKPILDEVKIPLVKSVTNPSRYDLIASLKRIPALKKYNFNEITAIPYEYNTKTKKESAFLYNPKAFDSKSDENLLTVAQIEKQQDVHYGEEYKQNTSRRMVYILHLEPRITTNKTSVLKCVMCQNMATLADLDTNLAFCSYECLEK